MNFTFLQHWLFYVFLSVFSLVFGFTFVKLASVEIHPLLYTTTGFVATTLCSFLIVLCRNINKARAGLSRHTLLLALVIGLIAASNDLNQILMYFAKAPLSISIPLFSAGGIILYVLAGVLFFRERISRIQMLGIVFAASGIVLLNV